MELSLRGFARACVELPEGYELVPWHESLLEAHADVKCRSFAGEVDSQVFPCLGDAGGCLRLMREISNKPGFYPEATWLLMHRMPYVGRIDYCGTVQAIVTRERFGLSIGGIQNLGITPEHRGRGLGTRLLFQALSAMANSRVRRASLEVTTQNSRALELYQAIGFRRTKTVYKAVEVAYT
ncbi:MAG: GNAT family N-acetyltransferase [Planctomycetales bacterium]|nr:GNAT family N-acetyltransferase [Planctomycetales bacterium]